MRADGRCTVTPIWLLDVDGVLNAVRRPGEEHSVVTANGYRICFRRPVIDFVRRIHETGLAEVRWLTTWADDANAALGAHFGFPTFTVAGGPADPCAPHLWWKLPLAQKAVAEGRPVIWTDDDLDYDKGAWKWVSETAHLLGISPRTDTGLTDKHLEEIEAFCLRYAESRAS